MLSFFKIISTLEGLSLVLLLLVAVPLKYLFAYPALVPYVGMTHGLLFIAYLFVSLIVAQQKNWSLGLFLLVFLLAFIPFGFLFLNRAIERLSVNAA